MSLHPEKIGEVPEETARVAKACFPRGNRYIRLRDTLGTIFDDNEFADLFPRKGQPAEAPWRLALVCLVQYLEELTDRQAADAVRSRMDIKYLLGLELTDHESRATTKQEIHHSTIDKRHYSVSRRCRC